MSDISKKPQGEEMDFSNMSFNDFLASVYADLGEARPATAETPDSGAEPEFEPAETFPAAKEPSPAAEMPEEADFSSEDETRVFTAVAVSEAEPISDDEPTGELPDLEEPAALPSPKKRVRVGRIVIGVLIALVVLTAAAVAAIMINREYEAAYVLSLPETAVQRFIDSAGEDYWINGISSAAAVSTTEFESSDELVEKFFLSKVRGAEFTFRKYAMEFTATAPVYIISADGTDLCRVDLSLMEENSAGFGFELWQVSKVELLESFLKLDTRSIELNVKEDVKILINGIEVASSYAIPDEDDHIATYRIDGLYDDYSLEVINAEGQSETPLSSSSENGLDSYSYPVPGKMEFSFSITAPIDAVITIGETRLDSANVTGVGSYELFDDLPSLLSIESFEDDTIAAIREAISKKPSFATYEYSVYEYEKPAMSIAPGKSCDSITCLEMADGSFYCTPGSSKSPAENAEERAESFIRTFVNYRSNAGGDKNANLDKLTPYLLKGSDLYKRIVGSTETDALSEASVVTYDYMELSDFISYGDILVTCRVSFGISGISTKGEYELELIYDLAMVLIDDTWRVAGMASVG